MSIAENNIKIYDKFENFRTIMSVNEDENTKIFKPYQHYVSVRVSQYIRPYDGIYETVNNAINNIPNGYEVYTIYPVAMVPGTIPRSQTMGYNVWFVNNKKVEATLSYDDIAKQYGYYTFGKVKEKQKVKN